MTRQLLLESLLAPFGVAALLVLLARRLASSRLRAAAVELAVLTGFLAAYGLILGLPGWPPLSARDKLVAVGLIGAVLGMVMSRTRIGRAITPTVLLLWPVAIAGWLAWPAVQALSPEPLALTFALAAVGAGFLRRWERDGCRGAQRAVMLMAAALGLALVAGTGSALSLAQLALALAAAVGGAALLGRAADRAGAVLLGPASLALGLAVNLALFSEADRLALLCLAPILWADWLTRQLARGKPAGVQWLVFAGGCLFPIGLAATVIRGLG